MLIDLKLFLIKFPSPLCNKMEPNLWNMSQKLTNQKYLEGFRDLLNYKLHAR